MPVNQEDASTSNVDVTVTQIVDNLRPDVGEIIPKESLFGFNWILHFEDDNTFYASPDVVLELIQNPSRLSDIPIMPVKSNPELTNELTVKINEKLIYQATGIDNFDIDDIIEIVMRSVGKRDEPSEPKFTIERKLITVIPQYGRDDLTFTHGTQVQSFTNRDINVSEPRPSSAPRGYIPDQIKKTGELSPNGQWRWSGSSWEKIG